MREVFFRAFLLVAYCALVIAATTPRDAPTMSGHVPSTSDHVPSTSGHVPSTSDHVPSTSDHVPSTSDHVPSTSEVYKVEVIDLYLKELYKIISFNTKYVSVNDIWNNIYQIPYIAERRSESATNHIYIQLTIITPGQPFIKINNETSAASNTNVYVADAVVFLATEPTQFNILYIVKDESPAESKKSTVPLKKRKTLVTGKKSIVLDYVKFNTSTRTSKGIWAEANMRMGQTRADWLDEVSVWHNVEKIRVKACDDNGKVTTKELLKKSRQSNKQFETENGGIYVALESMSQPGSESGVKHIVPLWINIESEEAYYVGVFRFTENSTKRSIWQKLKSYLRHSRFYSTRRLVEVRIEMIGIENLVITENDVNGTSSPVNFENAIAVVFTVHSIVQQETLMSAVRSISNNSIVQQELPNNSGPRTHEPHIGGLDKDTLESHLPKIEATPEMENETCAICRREFKEKEEHKEKDELKEKEEHKEKDELKEKEEHKEKEKEELTQLPCNHFFHRECVKSWLVLKAKCPLCCRNLTHWGTP